MKHVSFWNRAVHFDGGPFPARIEIGGRDILTSPMRLQVVREGRVLPWKTDPPILQRRTDCGETHVFPAEIPDARMICDTAVRIENDGFFWFDVTLIPRTSQYPQFDSVCLEIPLSREICTLMHVFALETEIPIPCPVSGPFPGEGIALPFVPSLWIGTEERGFSLMMESPAGCRLRDPHTMIECIPEGETMRLRLHLLDEKPPFWCPPDDWGNAHEPITFSFGFILTPVKPYSKVKGFDRAVHVYLSNFSMETIEEYYKLGAKYLVFHECWSLIQNYSCCSDPDKLRAVVEYCHSHDMKVLVYFGYEFSSLMPDFARVFREYANQFAHEEEHFRGHWMRSPAQKDYVCCYKSRYSRVMLEQVENAMDTFRLDGIYTDGTVIPQCCANARHGCGWRDEAGKLHASYPLLAYREHARKLNDIVKARGGMWDAHTGGCCIPAILGFADSYWDGEAQQSVFHDDVDSVSFDHIRAQYAGKNWGVPSQFIAYGDENATFLNISAFLLVCGIPTRPIGLGTLRDIAPFWKMMDEFDTDHADFCPPWDPQGKIRTDRADVYASCWIKDGRALAVLFNKSRGSVTVTVECMGRTRTVEAAPRSPVMLAF